MSQLSQELIAILNSYSHNQSQTSLTTLIRPARLAVRDDLHFKSSLSAEPAFWTAFGSVWSDHARLIADGDITVLEPIATLAYFTASLASGNPVGQSNAMEFVEPHLRSVLVTTSSYFNLEDDSYSTTTRACCQALANLVTNNDAVAGAYLPKCLSWGTGQDIVSRLLDSKDSSILLAVLVFLLNSIFGSPERSLLLAESPSGSKLVDRVLSHAASRFDGETKEAFIEDEFEDDVFGVTYAIIRQLIIQGAFPAAFAAQAAGGGFEIGNSQIMLLKFLDGYLHTLTTDSSPSSSISSFLLSTLVTLSKSVQIVGKAMDERDAATCSAIVLVLHCLSSIGLASDVGRAQILDCTEATVGLLAWSDQINKEQRSSNEAATWVEPEALGQLKRSCVRLLGVVCYEQQVAQNRIRECGGLTLLLGMCQIDDTNLTLREHALFAIRNILHNNAENQAIVSEMKAQYLVGPQGQLQDLPPALR
ncbi:ataxin-10, partial [Phenoliferia sp. Uapishka_3]